MDTRVELDDENRRKLFSLLDKRYRSNAELASMIGVSTRTIRDWRRGKYTIPKIRFEAMLGIVGVEPSEIIFDEKSAWWYTSKAGHMGGRSYIERYGRLGDSESRAHGGRRSYELRKHKENDIFTRKRINLPSRNEQLAEFIGIMMGDGSVGKYQISIALDSETDADYVEYVSCLINDLFGAHPTLQRRRSARCTVAVLSSVDLAEYMVHLGLPCGHKLKAGLDIPDWIRYEPRYVIACLRGLFDTDGSLFLEKHTYKDKVYKYPRLSLVSLSSALRETVLELLLNLNIAATIRGDRSVSVEHFTDIEKYFTIVGSSNPKHLSRWAASGGVG